jgi:hypothetical protein
MDRSNHYEAAFEGWLQSQRLCYVAVDEARRCVLDLDEAPLKSLDFIIYGPRGARLVVDVKGRRFPSGKPGRERRVWKNWTMQEDAEALGRWAQRFGPDYRGVLVFTYHILPQVELPEDTEDLFVWRGRRYLLRAIDAREYHRHQRLLSPGWGTVFLPSAVFRELVRPVRYFTHALPLIPDECPF